MPSTQRAGGADGKETTRPQTNRNRESGEKGVKG
jgi:hypothetical protein